MDGIVGDHSTPLTLEGVGDIASQNSGQKTSSERFTLFKHLDKAVNLDQVHDVCRAKRSSRRLEGSVRKADSIGCTEALYSLANLFSLDRPDLLHQCRESDHDEITQRRNVVFVGSLENVDMKHQVGTSRVCEKHRSLIVREVVEMANHGMNCLWVIVVTKRYGLARSDLSIIQYIQQ